MKHKIFFLLAFLMAAGCTDQPKATKVLQDNGYTDVQITGYSPFACSDSDTFSTGFRAKSPSGVVVSGTVCSGFLKGATIRFD